MPKSIALVFILLSASCFGQVMPMTPAALDSAIEASGPLSLGSAWNNRVANANLIDLLASNPPWYPLLAPGNPLGWAMANLYRLRWNRAVAKVGTPYASANHSMRLTHLYSSSWIVENDKMTWAIDLVEGPFATFGFAGAPGLPEITAMCNNLDVLFITHTDADHFSLDAMAEMLLQGKPVVCPPDLAGLALLAGAPASLIFVPTTGTNSVTTANGVLTFENYKGTQRAGTPSQVDCNAYSFRMDSGKHVIHAGDTDNPAFAVYVDRREWFADYLLNPGVADIPFDYQFLSHELEFTHFGPAFLHLNMPAVGPTPHNRYVLLWGESLAL